MFFSMQVVNHLDFEYFTKETGRSPAKSDEITLFSAKATFSHASHQLSQIILVNHN